MCVFAVFRVVVFPLRAATPATTPRPGRLGVIAVVAVAHVQPIGRGRHREAQNPVVQLGHLVLLDLLVLTLL